MTEIQAVTSISTHRGRANEFTPIEAGEATLVLNNRDGTYDPSNISGPYYGQLEPMQRVQISWPHPFTGVEYDVFAGYVEDWEPKRILATGSQVTLPLTDGFELLTQGQVNPTSALHYAAQHIDARLHAAADDVGWPTSLRRFATGNVNLQGITYDIGTPALEVIQDGVWAEFPGAAKLFCDRSGVLTFTGRGIRFGLGGDPPWVSYPTWCKLWRVGDAAACVSDPTRIPMFDMAWSLGKEGIYNDVVSAHRNASAAAIAANHVTDPDSIENHYGRRSLSILDLIVLDGSTSGKSAIGETRDFATYYRNNYSTAIPRIRSMVFRGQMDDGYTTPGGYSGGLWDLILGVELGHVVEVATEEPGGGGFIPDLDTKAGYFFVEGISHEVTALNNAIPRWSMTLELSPMARFTSYP